MATNTEKIVVQVIVKGDKQLDKLEKKTGTTTKGFAKMALGIGAAVAAFRKINRVVSGAIRTFREFEFQMAKTRAISGASEKDFKKLSTTAQDLGRSTFFTATQVAQLQTNYAKLGFTTREILNAQEATLLLATATGSDLGRAAIVAGAAVRGFGLDASETTRVVDVMTLAFNSSALDIEKWQTSMTKVAPIAAGMNIPLEDTAAIMGTLTDAGIEASIAGTSMRNIFLKMKDASSDLSQFLGFTVNSSVDLAKALEKLGAASDTTLDGLVNIRQVAAFSVMVKGRKRVEKLTEELRNAEDAAQEAASIIGDTLEGAFKRLASATQGLAITLTADLGKGLQGMIDRLAGFINRVEKNSDSIAKWTRNIVNAIKWIVKIKIAIYAATTSFRVFTAASLGATTMNGAFMRSLVLARTGVRALTVSLNTAKIAVKSLLISTGIGALVVVLTTLAEKWFFAADATDEATESNDEYLKSLKEIERKEKEFSDFNDKKLAKTIKQGKIDENEQKKARDNWEDAIAANLEKLKETKEGDKANIFLKNLIKKQQKELMSLEDKLLRIQLNNAQIRAHSLQKAFDDDKKASEDKYARKVKDEKNNFLNGVISKEQLDERLEKLELEHQVEMKNILTKHKEETLEIEEDILDSRIKLKETEIKKLAELEEKEEARKKQDFEDTIKFLEEVSDDYWDSLLEDVYNGAEKEKDQAKKLLEFKIDLIDNLLKDESLSIEQKEELEKRKHDLIMQQMKVEHDAQIQLTEEELEKQKEISRQKLEVMKAASDAIFTIMTDNLRSQTDRETKKLEERKDAGLITEEQYEEGVEAIQRKAFEKKKRLDIAQAIINGALAMTTVMGQTGVLSFAFSPFIAAMTAAQIAVIASQKFALGGMVEEFAKGGMVNGKSHAQGGEKFAVGGRVVELEGGEAVINKRSTAMFRPQLSAMNSAGGGVKFADGGLLNQPSFNQQQFNALGQNQMMGAMGGSRKVVVVEADITDSQDSVSVIQAQATI